MSAPRMRTTRGKVLIWVLGGVGTVLAGIATLAASHVLTWFDPPDTTSVVLAQNEALVRSLTQTLDRLTAQQAASRSSAVSAPASDDVVSSAPPVETLIVPSAPPGRMSGTSDLSQSVEPSNSEVARGEIASAVSLRVEPSASAPQLAAQETLVADLPETPSLPSAVPRGNDANPVAPQPVRLPPAAVVPVSFGVFENEAFSMCGHTGFAVHLSEQKLVLSSNDRTIPGRTFRGYEKILEPGQAAVLWPDCSVAVGYTTAAGVVRIAISVVGGK